MERDKRKFVERIILSKFILSGGKMFFLPALNKQAYNKRSTVECAKLDSWYFPPCKYEITSQECNAEACKLLDYITEREIE